MAGLLLIEREVSSLSELILLCQRGSFGEVLARRTLEDLGGLLEADVVEISGLNPVVQVAYLCGPDDGDCHRTLVQAGGAQIEQPFWRHYWFTERSPLTGMRHELSMNLADFAGRTVRLTCSRAHDPDFDDRCRMLLRLLKPHLEQAYRA